MIIASPSKSDIIPLQPIVTPSASLASSAATLGSRVKLGSSADLAKRSQHSEDFVANFFPGSPLNTQVDEILTFSMAPRSVECQAFIHHQTIFLLSPFGDLGQQDWAVGEFQSCITHLIELAEEKTECSSLVVAMDHRNKDHMNTLLRAFMYLGFQLIDPAMYHQEAGVVLVGYEL